MRFGAGVENRVNKVRSKPQRSGDKRNFCAVGPQLQRLHQFLNFSGSHVERLNDNTLNILSSPKSINISS